MCYNLFPLIRFHFQFIIPLLFYYSFLFIDFSMLNDIFFIDTSVLDFIANITILIINVREGVFTDDISLINSIIITSV